MNEEGPLKGNTTPGAGNVMVYPRGSPPASLLTPNSEIILDFERRIKELEERLKAVEGDSI